MEKSCKCDNLTGLLLASLHKNSSTQRLGISRYQSVEVTNMLMAAKLDLKTTLGGAVEQQQTPGPGNS